jgi:hypothetical protein
VKELWPARRGCGTCYLLAVGAAVEPWRLAKLLEDQLREDVEVAPAPDRIRAAFPPNDSVWLITRRSCSCDLVEGAPAVGRTSRLEVAVKSALRAPLVRGVGELQALRVYVSSGAEPAPFSSAPRPRSLDELTALSESLPLDSLIELTRSPRLAPPA